MFIDGSFVAMVTYHITLMSTTCQAFIGVSYGVLTLLLSETVGQIQSFQIVQFVESVKTGLSLLMYKILKP